jgi:TM2 domain-containing membrane protein YozV
MIQPAILTTAPLNDQQRAMFYSQMALVQKDEVLGILLALFLGTFGLHHFYLRRNGLGILYLVFFWTGIPSLLGFFECFFMPGRVRRFNAAEAQVVMATILAGGYPTYVPAWANPASFTAVTCAACGAAGAVGARYCKQCGSVLAS